MSKTLLLLGGSKQQVVAIEKAKELGYRTVLCDYLPDNPGQYVADSFYLVSTTDRDAVLEVARAESVDGVLAYASDPAALSAAYVAESLGLPTNPMSAVETMSEKHRFREMLRTNGLPCPRSRAFFCGGPLSEIKQECSSLEFPLVIKPTDSSGSKGVTIVKSKSGLEEAISNAAAFSRNGILIAEEYIEKGFPHIIGGDVFVLDGSIRFWGLMSCLRDEALGGLVPVGEYLPSGLSSSQFSAVKRTLMQLVEALGVRFGELNVEVILDEDGTPFVLELGARAGGNMIPLQLSDASGIDLVKANVLCALGEDPGEIDWDSSCVDGAYSTYVVHSASRGIFQGIRHASHVASLLYREELYLDLGHEVEQFDGANKALGIAFLRWDDALGMHRDLNSLAQELSPIVDPDCHLSISKVKDEEELREVWGFVGDAYSPPLWERVEDYGTYLKKVADNGITLVARNSESILGAVSFYSNDVESKRAFITQLMVSPRSQGLGVGSRLLYAFETIAISMGMKFAALEVRLDNAGAKRLYERFGYCVVGSTDTGSIMEKRIAIEGMEGVGNES